MIISDAIAEFKRLHSGVIPVEILITPAASVIIAVQESGSLSSIFDGIPVRISDMPSLVNIGAGTRLVLAAPDLPGGRIGVVACETL